MTVEPQVQQFIDFIRDEMPRRIKTNPNSLPDAQKLLVSVSGTLEVIYKTLAELDIAIKSDVDTELTNKEPTITEGTSAQYFRGDKTWQTLNTDAVSETESRVYLNPEQKTVATQAASSSQSGYLTSTDWSTFNGKQAALPDVITAGTYGSGSKIPRATYNAKGIVTGITEVDLVTGITPVAYTNGTAYTVGQVVSFDNNLYRVVTAHTASTTPNGNIDLIGDVCKVYVGSSFTAYRLSNLANPASNKTLEVWGSGTTFTLDLVNAPSKVIFRTTNAYNVTTLTISRAGSTFYYNKDATSVGSNSVSLNVVGGCTLEITVYTAEVLVHVIQQPTIQGFKLVNTATAGSTNVGVSFAGSISADVVYTLANKAINFGDLPSVATTNSNNLTGNARILKGSYCTVDSNSPVVVNGTYIGTELNTGGAGFVRGGQYSGAGASFARQAYATVGLFAYSANPNGQTSSLFSIALDAGDIVPKAIPRVSVGSTHSFTVMHILSFCVTIRATPVSASELVWAGRRRIICRRQGAQSAPTYGIHILSVTTEGTDFVESGITGQLISVSLGAISDASTALSNAPLNIVASHTTSASTEHILVQATLESHYITLG